MTISSNSWNLQDPSPDLLRLILRLGHILLFFVLAVWLALVLFVGEPYGHTGWIILLTIFFGRGAAVGAGLNLDFNPFFLFYQAAAADMLCVLYLFPLFVRGYGRLTKIPYVGGYLNNLHNAALAYKSYVAPYGIFGLLIFVIFPFWSTGPLVGSIVGFLLGLPTRATLLTVSIGNIVAVGLWVYFYDLLNDWNQSAALALLFVIILCALVGIVYAQIKRNRGTK